MNTEKRIAGSGDADIEGLPYHDAQPTREKALIGAAGVHFVASQLSLR